MEKPVQKKYYKDYIAIKAESQLRILIENVTSSFWGKPESTPHKDHEYLKHQPFVQDNFIFHKCGCGHNDKNDCYEKINCYTSFRKPTR